MHTKERILTIRLLEKLAQLPAHVQAPGIETVSPSADRPDSRP